MCLLCLVCILLELSKKTLEPGRSSPLPFELALRIGAQWHTYADRSDGSSEA